MAFAEDSAVAGRTRQMGIILDTEDETILKSFHELKQDLNLKQEEFKMIICREKATEKVFFDTPVICRRDFGWNGKSSEEVSTFLNAKYDVVISFTASENKMANFLVSVTRARLKVGRRTEDKKGIFDLNISADISSPEIFKSELKKYLKILKSAG